MIWIVLLSLFILANIVGFFVLTSPAIAAVPPQQDEDRIADAQYIVVGNVRDIATEEVSVDWGTNHQSTVLVDVIRIEKGNPPLLPSNAVPDGIQQIQVHYWQYGDRPLGWSGDAGQSGRLVTDTGVRLFLWQDAQGQLNLLTPNGWEYAD